MIVLIVINDNLKYLEIKYLYLNKINNNQQF